MKPWPRSSSEPHHEPRDGGGGTHLSGAVPAEWRASENNRRAKYYSLTRAGRKVLEREAANWERLSAAISLIVRARTIE